MFRMLLLSLFALLLTAMADTSEGDVCAAGDCSAPVQSPSLMQRKHVAKHHKAKVHTHEAPCDGVEAHGRCWHLSEKGESCESTCLRHGRSFKFKASDVEKPMMPMLLKREAQSKEGPARAFECYSPDEDHFSLVNHCSSKDYRDNQGSFSDESCQLACPCGRVKECSWKQPEACTPVFQYKDFQYTGCPKADSDRPWCSHDHDKADEWSYCQYACTDAAANGATEMFSEPPFPEEADDSEVMLASVGATTISAINVDCSKHKELMPKEAANKKEDTKKKEDTNGVDAKMTDAESTDASKKESTIADKKISIASQNSINGEAITVPKNEPSSEDEQRLLKQWLLKATGKESDETMNAATSLNSEMETSASDKSKISQAKESVATVSAPASSVDASIHRETDKQPAADAFVAAAAPKQDDFVNTVEQHKFPVEGTQDENADSEEKKKEEDQSHPVAEAPHVSEGDASDVNSSSSIGNSTLEPEKSASQWATIGSFFFGMFLHLILLA